MHRCYPLFSLPSRWSRAVAALAAAVILLLSLSVVSPELHGWLHDSTDDHGSVTCDHGSNAGSHTESDAEGDHHTCAVTLFAQGVVHHAAAAIVQPCEGLLRAVNYRAFEQLALAQPRHLHRPPQAPPAV